MREGVKGIKTDFMTEDERDVRRVITCPKCAGRMDRVWRRSILIDRCAQCGGMWLDSNETEWLKAEAGSEDVDSGDPKIGEIQNRKGLISCPVCQTPMIRMVDAGQPHIWYEKCANCFGVYFDAGEFKDLKEETLDDFIKTIYLTERR